MPTLCIATGALIMEAHQVDIRFSGTKASHEGAFLLDPRATGAY